MIKFKLSVPVIEENWWDRSKNELTKVLLTDNQEDWRDQQDPQTGAKWAPRKQPTGNWPILRKTGRMQDGTRMKSPATGIFSAKMGAPYGGFHMTGTSKMVARPWLGIPVRTMPKMAEVISRKIFKRSNRTYS